MSATRLSCMTSARAQAIQNVFSDSDSDGSGEMDIQELEKALITLGTRPSALELKHIVKKYDTNNSGSLSLDEACTTRHPIQPRRRLDASSPR